MSEVAIEAMKDRNGWDTHNGIPRKLKSLAYDLWGRDPKQCALCGSSQSPHLHHCAPEVMKFMKGAWPDHKDEENWMNPYNDTEPWQLVPLCPSCHRKVENMNFSLMKYAMWWAALKKAEEYARGLDEYLEERVSDISAHRRTPLDHDAWSSDNAGTSQTGGEDSGAT